MLVSGCTDGRTGTGRNETVIGISYFFNFKRYIKLYVGFKYWSSLYPNAKIQKTYNSRGHFLTILSGRSLVVQIWSECYRSTQFSALGGSFSYQQIELKTKTNPNDAQRCRLGSFWFSTRPTAVGGTDYNLHHALKSHQCLPLP